MIGTGPSFTASTNMCAPKRPVTTDDLFTTVYHTLGIDPDDEYVTEERYVRLGGFGGKVIRELF